MRMRLVCTLVVVIGLIAPTTVSAQSGAQLSAFDVSGTVVSITGNVMKFHTSDITGQPAVIEIDISSIGARYLPDGMAVTLTIGPRLTDIPLAWRIVEQGSQTMKTDFGARAEFETVNETAEVQNRPDDDEARAKQKHPKGKED
jgi:hypothetical protein